MFKDPEAFLWVMEDGDGLTLCVCDLVVASFKVDGVVMVDPAGVAQGEVQIEQGGWGRGA